MAAARKAAKLTRLTSADLAALQKDMLPDEAREQLGMLVTEVHGVAKVLRATYDIVGDDDEDLYSAVSMWVDRIAHDLGAMECRRYPAESAEAT